MYSGQGATVIIRMVSGVLLLLASLGFLLLRGLLFPPSPLLLEDFAIFQPVVLDGMVVVKGEAVVVVVVVVIRPSRLK